MLPKPIYNLYKSSLLRRLFLPVLSKLNPGDIHIRHHYTGRRFLIHSFQHKGYWFHGKRREKETMAFFEQVVRKGDTVLEVGGHVGYLTVFFDQLVGVSGSVVVFEPGKNNSKYIHANTRDLPSVEIVRNAISNTNGIAAFFEESLTGQNNSLIGDYKVFQENRARAYSSAEYRHRKIKTVRLDTFCHERKLRPDVIKIDIEGAEFMALEGGVQMLAESKPLLMVEVTRQAEQVFNFLSRHGYQLFSPEGKQVSAPNCIRGNLCAVHPDNHRDRLHGSVWANGCMLSAG